jgi:hypothetical protein
MSLKNVFCTLESLCLPMTEILATALGYLRISTPVNHVIVVMHPSFISSPTYHTCIVSSVCKLCLRQKMFYFFISKMFCCCMYPFHKLLCGMKLSVVMKSKKLVADICKFYWLVKNLGSMPCQIILNLDLWDICIFSNF